ncbi:uncharacterized protein METZ01_LOCUS418375, partial [marine metagenome]
GDGVSIASKGNLMVGMQGQSNFVYDADFGTMQVYEKVGDHSDTKLVDGYGVFYEKNIDSNGIAKLVLPPSDLDTSHYTPRKQPLIDSNGGELSLNVSEGDLQLLGAIISEGGDVALGSENNLKFSSSGSVYSSGGDVELSSDQNSNAAGGDGGLTMIEGAEVDADNGGITIKGTGDLTLARVNTTGKIELNTTSGNLHLGEHTVSAGSLVLVAQGGSIAGAVDAGSVDLQAAGKVAISSKGDELTVLRATGDGVSVIAQGKLSVGGKDNIGLV